MKTVYLVILIVTIMVLSLAHVTLRALDVIAKNDCEGWKTQAVTTPGFFITQDEKTQCDYYHINTGARVK